MQKIKVFWDVLLRDWAITHPVVGLISLPTLPLPSLTFLFVYILFQQSLK